jgi:hypothetical protein
MNSSKVPLFKTYRLPTGGRALMLTLNQSYRTSNSQLALLKDLKNIPSLKLCLYTQEQSTQIFSPTRIHVICSSLLSHAVAAASSILKLEPGQVFI